MSPSGSNFSPDKPEELSLGRCSFYKGHAGKYDEGNWTCLFARETGLPEERLVVSVGFNGEMIKNLFIKIILYYRYSLTILILLIFLKKE